MNRFDLVFVEFLLRGFSDHEIAARILNLRNDNPNASCQPGHLADGWVELTT